MSDSNKQHSGQCPFCLTEVPKQASVCKGCGASYVETGFSEGHTRALSMLCLLGFIFIIAGIMMIGEGGRDVGNGYAVIFIVITVIVFFYRIASKAAKKLIWKRSV